MLNTQAVNSQGFANWLLNKVSQVVNGRASHLMYFHDFVAGQKMTAQHNLGIQNVDVKKIKGSMNASRTQDFDAQFKLVNNHSQERLAGVARVWQQRQLPPVMLVQVGNVYFVQDGHHRVSVAYSNDQATIKANVTLVEYAPVASADSNGVAAAA